MYTFPGGMFEPTDACLKVTAMRELFEETGVLLLDRSGVSGPQHEPHTIRNWQERIHADASQFHAIAQTQLHASIRWSALRHFCTFITPTFEKRKYTTLFFLAAATADDCQTLQIDGHETAAVCWVDPDDALARNAAGVMSFIPPQFYVLSELAAHTSLEKVLDAFPAIPSGTDFAAHSAAAAIDCRGLPAMQPALVPNPTTTGRGSEGRYAKYEVLTLPRDECHPEHPGNPGQRHRVYCPTPFPPGKSGFILDKNI